MANKYEFGGPVGALATMLSLPIVVYFLYWTCTEQYCGLLPPSFGFPWSWSALLVFNGWMLFQAALLLILPGKQAPGQPLPAPHGTLYYPINGFSAFVVTILLVALGVWMDVLDLTFLYRHYPEMISASILFSFTLSCYLYLSARLKKGVLLAKGGNTGNVIYDFFIGHELNPRIGNFDLKVFCELRPGLIGWVVLDIAMAMQQYSEYGAVSNGMVLICLFQAFYVVDALWSEESILTTMDVTTDGFGFMLAFGDLTWVPFTYSLQARYLASQPYSDLDIWAVAALISLKILGYSIFRGANGQKDQFRRDPSHPSVKHLKSMPTKRGTRLIISGWWGLARHINYTGDWLMAWSWCLPCGFSHIIPYFYVIYFAILLVHRDLRDEDHCRLKYGSDWDEYCKKVPYRFIPYLF